MLSSALYCAVLARLLTPGVVSAHETRFIAHGRYQVVVEFLAESAYEGELSALSLVVTDKTQKAQNGTSDKPVERVEQTLKAGVLVGGKTLPLQVRTRFGQTGAYVANFQPTRAGQYRFRIFGQIEGRAIDETFESGPSRFNDVESPSALQFPEQQAAVPDKLEALLEAAEGRADTGQTLGVAGLVVGLLGPGGRGSRAAASVARRESHKLNAPPFTVARRGRLLGRDRLHCPALDGHRGHRPCGAVPRTCRASGYGRALALGGAAGARPA